MGSSRPAFWVEQSSRRKEISRLFERKRKTIAFLGGGLFILKVLSIQKMVKQPGFRFSLAILAFCLCLGSQAILPMPNVVGVSVLEVSEIDFDQTEFEEELMVAVVVATLVGLIFSKYGSMNLGFRTANLLSVFPPPKHT
jgi:hypothetical protein